MYFCPFLERSSKLASTAALVAALIGSMSVLTCSLPGKQIRALFTLSIGLISVSWWIKESKVPRQYPDQYTSAAEETG